MVLISETDRGYSYKTSHELSEQTGVGALPKTCNMNIHKNNGRQKKVQ